MGSSQNACVARHCDAGEIREVHLVPRANGGLHILQCSWGTLTELAFGEKSVCQRLSLDAEAASMLAARLGWACSVEEGLARFFSSSEAYLSDLLDECNRSGIACRFCTIGSKTGAAPSGRAILERRVAPGRVLRLVP